MKIGTKFDLKDKVFFIDENKVVEAQIVHINIRVYYRKNSETDYKLVETIKVDYTTTYLNSKKDSIDKELNESYLFATKEELLKSL